MGMYRQMATVSSFHLPLPPGRLWPHGPRDPEQHLRHPDCEQGRLKHKTAKMNEERETELPRGGGRGGTSKDWLPSSPPLPFPNRTGRGDGMSV